MSHRYLIEILREIEGDFAIFLDLNRNKVEKLSSEVDELRNDLYIAKLQTTECGVSSKQSVIDYAAANGLPLMADGSLANPEKFGVV